MKRSLLSLWFLCVGLWACAQEFDTYFKDSTLRIDCRFSGTVAHQSVSVDRLYKSAGWYGRRMRMDSLPVEGNGQVLLRHHATKRVIYKQSFSTLFQEWLSYPEATQRNRSFEDVLLVPMPKDTVEVTIALCDNRRKVMVETTFPVYPGDILIRPIGDQPTPFVQIQAPADSSHCIHLAFLAEGYTEEEMPKYEKDVHRAVEAIFRHEPFKSFRKNFCIVAVKSASQESGVSVPRAGQWRKTAVGAHFDTFYSSRYLTTPNLCKVHDLLAGIPYEHIIILANTKTYGGGGIYGQYLLATTDHPSSEPVIVHEFGHSFCGLADEYAYENEQIPMYPHDVEPWERNITTQVDFQGKWENIPDAGMYEGAGYSLRGVYRAYKDCRMRSNDTPDFCKACQKALQEYIRFFLE